MSKIFLALVLSAAIIPLSAMDGQAGPSAKQQTAEPLQAIEAQAGPTEPRAIPSLQDFCATVVAIHNLPQSTDPKKSPEQARKAVLPEQLCDLVEDYRFCLDPNTVRPHTNYEFFSPPFLENTAARGYFALVLHHFRHRNDTSFAAWTPFCVRQSLIPAARSGHLPVLAFLVEHGKIDAENMAILKDEALIGAVFYGHLSAVRFLVEQGKAGIHATDLNGPDAPLRNAQWYGANGDDAFLLQRATQKRAVAEYLQQKMDEEKAAQPGTNV